MPQQQPENQIQKEDKEKSNSEEEYEYEEEEGEVEQEEEGLAAEKLLAVGAKDHDPFALEPYDPQKKKIEKKIKSRQQTLEEDLVEHEKMLESHRLKEVKNNRYQRLKQILWLVRAIGCLIVTLDCVLKVQYYATSRFINQQVKDVYKAFLFLRPAAIFCIVLFNFFIRASEVYYFKLRIQDYTQRLVGPLIPGSEEKEEQVSVKENDFMMEGGENKSSSGSDNSSSSSSSSSSAESSS